MCDVVFRVRESMASTTRRMSAEFFPVLTAAWDFDQLDGRLVQRTGIAAEAVPVAVAFLTTTLPFSTSRSRTRSISKRSRRF